MVPLAQLAPMQFSGTSNTEYFGPTIPRIFRLLQERQYDEATRLYWQIHPARKANQALIDLLATIGKRKLATPAQIALAWLLAQKPWIVPIPGTTKLHRLEENINAASVELTPDDLRDIESAASKIKVHGARYPETLEQLTGR